MMLHGKWPQLHLSNQSLPDAGCAYYLCEHRPNNLPNGLCFFYTSYLQYISVNWTSSPLSSSDNTSFWPLDKLPFNFHQVTLTISNSNLKNPFQRLLSVAANILSAIWICSCSLGASHRFSHTASILFLLQYPTTRNSYVMNIHQCAKKKEEYPNSKWFLLWHTKQGFVIEVWWKIS